MKDIFIKTQLLGKQGRAGVIPGVLNHDRYESETSSARCTAQVSPIFPYEHENN